MVERTWRIRFSWYDVGLGVVVAAVPAGFTVFAQELGGIPNWIKLVVGLSWSAAAVRLVFVGLRRDVAAQKSLGELTAQGRRQREQIRIASERRIFQGLLTPALTLPRKWRMVAYVYDEQKKALWPIWPRDLSPQMREVYAFAPGNGAAGLAWREGDIVVKYGTEVSDETHGLTEAQQAEFAPFQTAAAVPIWTDANDKLGVLTALAEDEDTYFDSAAGQALLREVATTLGVVLTSIGAAALGREPR